MDKNHFVDVELGGADVDVNPTKATNQAHSSNNNPIVTVSGNNSDSASQDQTAHSASSSAALVSTVQAFLPICTQSFLMCQRVLLFLLILLLSIIPLLPIAHTYNPWSHIPLSSHIPLFLLLLLLVVSLATSLKMTRVSFAMCMLLMVSFILSHHTAQASQPAEPERLRQLSLCEWIVFALLITIIYLILIIVHAHRFNRIIFIAILLLPVATAQDPKMLKSWPGARSEAILGNVPFCTVTICYGKAVSVGERSAIVSWPEKQWSVAPILSMIKTDSYNFIPQSPDSDLVLTCAEYADAVKSSGTILIGNARQYLYECHTQGFPWLKYQWVSDGGGSGGTNKNKCVYTGGFVTHQTTTYSGWGPLNMCSGQFFEIPNTDTGNNLHKSFKWTSRAAGIGSDSFTLYMNYTTRTNVAGLVTLEAMPGPIANCPTLDSTFKNFVRTSKQCVKYVSTSTQGTTFGPAGKLCATPGMQLCTENSCYPATPWSEQSELDGTWLCNTPFMLNPYPRFDGIPSVCYYHSGSWYTKGNYDLQGCEHYPGLTQCSTKPSCDSYSIPLLTWSDCTYPVWHEDFLCVFGPNHENNVNCEAGVGVSAVSVVCSKHVSVQMCCETCVMSEVNNVHSFSVPYSSYGSHCSLTWSGKKSQVFTLNHAHFSNGSSSLLWHLLSMPWWVICSVITSILWLAHFLFIRLRVLKILMFVWAFLNKTLWWFISTHIPPFPIDGSCDLKYKKKKCNAKVTLKNWPLHVLVWHGRWYHMFSPKHIWMRMTATELPMPVKEKKYVKTPIGPLSSGSWTFWLFVLLCFGHVKRCECFEFDWTGSSKTQTIDGVTIAFSKQTTHWDCVQLNYYKTDMSYKCDCYIKCSSNDACSFLPANRCTPNQQWNIDHTFFWREGCFLLGQGSGCCKCYLVDTSATKIVPRKRCTQKAISFSLHVSCSKGMTDVHVTDTGVYNTTCGVMTVTVPVPSITESIDFEVMDHKMYQVTDAKPYDSNGCSEQPLSCSHDVLPGGTIMSNCYPSNNRPYTPHVISSCSPEVDGERMTTRSCTHKTFTINFVPVIFTPTNSVLDDVSISNCYASGVTTCVCHITLKCNGTYFSDHYYPCQVPLIQSAICKDPEACVTFDKKEYCSKIDGYHPVPIEHKVPQYNTAHSGACFLCNWDLFNWHHILLIVIIFLSIIIILNVILWVYRRFVKKQK